MLAPCMSFEKVCIIYIYIWKVFNGNHYPGKGGIQPPHASLTDLMVMEV